MQLFKIKFGQAVPFAFTYGFKDISFLPPGTSPMGYIELLEKQHIQKQLNNII